VTPGSGKKIFARLDTLSELSRASCTTPSPPSSSMARSWAAIFWSAAADGARDPARLVRELFCALLRELLRDLLRELPAALLFLPLVFFVVVFGMEGLRG
jgi:hypothetical protein